MIVVKRLMWTDWNVSHIARHNVIPDEVEEAVKNVGYPEKGKKGRIRLIAPTQAGRMLAIVLDPEPEEGVYFPVTARDASRKERKLYQEKTGGETAA